MQKAYTRIVWENLPSVQTPLNETNLNRMDASLDTIDNRVVAMDTAKADESDLLQSLKNVTYNTQTGLFTFTWWNGATLNVDLNIEKIPVSFSMSSQGIITMTTSDGTTYTADVASLIKTYTFVDSTCIDFTVTTDLNGNKTVTADVKDGTITANKLNPDYLAELTVQAEIATAKAESATASAVEARSYAKGGTETRPSEDVDNAKYYKEQAEYFKDQAEDAMEQAGRLVLSASFSVDFTTGHLIYTSDAAFHFEVDGSTGHLMWEVVE